MSHISKPVDWEVFNIPPVQPVQYYSILKKKREFSQLIKQYDTQVFKQGYLHYCGIVPKNINSSFNNRYEIVIVFFDEIPSASFIGFRVKVSKETFTCESNSLLLFLKTSKKAIFYLMNNNCIHVQCGTNAWELFYLLYDNYLRRYVLTIIGTQFFYHFVYSHCIQREIQLLELLYKGSKVIRISKNSIYYKIHGKRKISVTDLIHMTNNMPKSKRYIISYFSSKESILYSDWKDSDFYTSNGSKINVSNLVLKKFKQFQNILSDDKTKNYVNFDEMSTLPNSTSYPNSESKISKFKAHKMCEVSSYTCTLKRKFEKVENNEYDVEPGPSTSSKNLEANSSYVNQWKHYHNIKPYTLKCYSNIPCINHIVPNLLENGKFSNSADSTSLINTTHQVSIFPLTKFNNLRKNNITIVGKMSEEVDHINSFNVSITDNIKAEEFISQNESPIKFKKLSDPGNQVNCVQPKKNSKRQNFDKSYPVLSKVNRTINQHYSDIVEDACFTTATGKTINISNASMLTANKLIQDVISDEKKEALHEKDNCESNKTSSHKINYKDFRNKTVTNYIPHAKFPVNKSFHSTKIFKESHSKKFETILSQKVDKNFMLDNFDTLEDASFSTAAGKTIQVSSTAIETACKIIHGVFNEENNSTSSKNINFDKHKICKSANTLLEDIGCSSKMSANETVDADMNNTLIEKFFEDAHFDDKEFESNTQHNNDKNSALVSKSNNLPSRKPRKSLGGRRNMRYCSSKH